ncbi:hypothetical protein [Nocardia sp. NPDC056100]|uniref:hypothetical protein n=1 Tax=Nocardia sp. NPDC056100 TaxID=3345712 RepID=UPI0035DAC9F1
MVLAGIVAASVTACGESASNSSEMTSAAPVRTSCDASVANGPVFASDVRPDMSFTLQLPRLQGWQPTPVSEDNEVLRVVDQHAGQAGRTTISLTVAHPHRVASHSLSVSGYAGNWRQWRSEPILVCGRDGNRAGGILPASDTEVIDQYREFLEFDYFTGELVYPILMMVKGTAADRDRYQTDVDTFVDRLQIVRTPPAG